MAILSMKMAHTVPPDSTVNKEQSTLTSSPAQVVPSSHLLKRLRLMIVLIVPQATTVNSKGRRQPIRKSKQGTMEVMRRNIVFPIPTNAQPQLTVLKVQKML